MDRRHRREIPLTEKIRHTEKWPTSVSWPAPIDDRLANLIDQAVDAGEVDTLSRSELLAALVLAAPNSGDELRRLLEKYRLANVSDAAVVKPDRGTEVIQLRERRPGRR